MTSYERPKITTARYVHGQARVGVPLTRSLKDGDQVRKGPLDRGQAVIGRNGKVSTGTRLANGKIVEKKGIQQMTVVHIEK